jgi:hypothetical protein
LQLRSDQFDPDRPERVRLPAGATVRGTSPIQAILFGMTTIEIVSDESVPDETVA